MDTVIAWMNNYWWVVLIGVAVAAKVARVTASHWSDHKGVKRWALYIVDLLDVVKTTPRPGGGK